MREIFKLILALLILLLPACASRQKLGQDKVKERIKELATLQLKDKQIQVDKITQISGNQAIAEANIKMAFKLSQTPRGEWQIDAIRLGDRNWIELKTFLSSLDEVRAYETRENLQKLVDGLKKFKDKNGNYPQAADVVKLTDLLFPAYMPQLVRYDGWNHEFIFNFISPNSFQLISVGADGIRGTSDDIVLTH